jgi:fucose permease
MSFTVAFSTFKGLGLPEEDILPACVDQLLEARYAGIVLFNPALNVTKASILLLYIDIARRPQAFLYIGSYVTLTVVLVGGVSFTFLTALQCRPVQAVYDLTVENPSCIPIEIIDLATVPVNVATGIVILILPIPVLTTLRLPLGQKSIVLLIFVLGVILIIVVDVVRIYYLQLAAIHLRQLTIRPPVSPEFLYTASLTALWSTVEVNMSIVGACIPTLPPLIKWLKLILDRSRENGNSQVLTSSSRQDGETEAGSLYPIELNPYQSSITSLRADYQEQLQPQICTTSTHRALDTEEALSLYQRSDVFAFSRSIRFEGSRCMLDMRGSESVKYCALVDILLFLEGFIIVMLFSVNGSKPVVENETQAIGINSATYGGGACIVPFLGYWLLRHVGFKATFLTALAIICMGTLIFWPSGALGSYPGFIVANVFVGTAITLLDMSAIAFLTLCGPTQYAEIRVLIGLGVGYCGSTLGLLLSEKVFFAHVANTRGLIYIQWTYLAVALSMVLLGLFYYYMPLPEATDVDLQGRDNSLWIYPSDRFFGKLPIIFMTLALSVFAEFCSTASLSSIRTFVGTLLESVSTSTHTSPHLTTLKLNIVLSAIYGGSHLVLSFLCLFIPPRILLLLLFACGITFSALIIWLDFSSAQTPEYIVLFFAIPLGPIPSLIYAMGLRGMGSWTKFGASVLEGGGNLGPTIYPWVIWALVRARSDSVQFSFYAIFAALVIGTVFPLYLNLVRAALPRTRYPVWSTGILSGSHPAHS